MKRSILLPILSLLLAGTGFRCKPNKIEPSLLTGKLVINAACGHYVIQVISGDVDPSLLVKSWKDSANDTTYTNVFTVKNVCSFPGFGLSRGDVFTFAMNDSVSVQNCMVCAIFYPTPPVSNFVSHVRIVKKAVN